MSLAETIKSNFQQILNDNGTIVTNSRTEQDFTALISSGDFMADFTEGDQENSQYIQLTIFRENDIKTGDTLLINNNKYKVQSITDRISGVIKKLTAYRTRK